MPEFNDLKTFIHEFQVKFKHEETVEGEKTELLLSSDEPFLKLTSPKMTNREMRRRIESKRRKNWGGGEREKRGERRRRQTET